MDEQSKILYDKYPKIFQDTNGKSSALIYGLMCGPGWFGIIDNLCDKLQKYIDASNKFGITVEQVRFQQVKEKFAELRIYYIGGDDRTSALIRQACTEASETCEDCGTNDPSKKVEVRGVSYYRTICNDCDEKVSRC